MPGLSASCGSFVRRSWVELFPWLTDYVSDRAAVIEDLAPDLDWWFSQTVTETATDTDVHALCRELARVFVLEHPEVRLIEAFPEVPATTRVADLELAARTHRALADALETGSPIEELPLISTVLNQTVAELLATPGVSKRAVRAITETLLNLSVSSAATSKPAHGPSLYRVAPSDPLGVPSDLDRIRSREVSSAVDMAIDELITFEGPISLNELARRVANRFGYLRVAPKRQDQLKRRVPRRMIRRSRMGSFVWPESLDPDKWRGFRGWSPDIDRRLDAIAPEEVANAIESLASEPTDRDSLFKATLEVFGRERLTAQARNRLDYCLSELLRDGRIESDGIVYCAGERP